MIASVLPRSAITFPNSSLFTIPLKIESFLSIKSLNCLSLSASLTLKLITCFAVCAAILPKSKDGKGWRTSSPIALSLLISFKLNASSNYISVFEFSKLPFCIEPKPKSLGLPIIGIPDSVVCKKLLSPIDCNPDSFENLANPTWPIVKNSEVP